MVFCPASIARAWVSDLLVDELTRSDGVEGSHFWFGYSVSLSGDMAVVGAPRDDENGAWSGSTYVFENGPAGWAEVARLLPEDGVAGDGFGRSVGIDGNTVVIGTPGPTNVDDRPGAAYVFEDNGEGWTQVAKLVSDEDPNGPYSLFEFGHSVSISGGTVLVGLPHMHSTYSDNKPGAAYVFEDDGAGWTQTAKLLAADPGASDQFGWSVAISGDKAIVGAPGTPMYGKKGEQVSKGGGLDKAYVFEKDGSGWTQVAQLTDEGQIGYDYFGSSVAISGDKAIVGAPQWLSSEGASAYIFEDEGTGWKAVDTLVGSNSTEFSEFGTSVAISGDTALITDSRDGYVYVFEQRDSGWTETALLMNLSGEDYYTLPVAIDGNTALVGSLSASADPDFPGTVYVFAVPEPSSILLLFAAGLCLAALRLRRR